MSGLLTNQVLKANIQVDTLGRYKLIQESILATDALLIQGLATFENGIGLSDSDPVFDIGHIYSELVELEETFDVSANFIRVFDEEVAVLDVASLESLDFFSNSFNHQVLSEDVLAINFGSMFFENYSLGESGSVAVYDYTTSPFFADDYVATTTASF